MPCLYSGFVHGRMSRQLSSAHLKCVKCFSYTHQIDITCLSHWPDQRQKRADKVKLNS